MLPSTLYGHTVVKAGAARASGRSMAVRNERCPIPNGRFRDDGVLEYCLDDEALWLRNGAGASVGVSDSHISVDDAEYDDYLFSVGAGLWFRRQGFLVLHANAVVKDGRAVLLMGASGAGKTTITHALLERGCELVTDDLGVVDLGFVNTGTAKPIILPGPGRLKIRTDDGGSQKQIEQVTAAGHPATVVAAVVLRPAGPVGMRPVLGPAASLTFVQHAHMPRSLHITKSEETHFAAACQLATSVPVFALDRGLERGDISAAVDAILNEVWP